MEPRLTSTEPGPGIAPDADEAIVRPRRPGHRPDRRWLAAVALAGAVGLLALVRILAATPHVEATWRNDARGELELVASPLTPLQPLVGQRLTGVKAPLGQPIDAEALAVRTSPRWTVDDALARRQVAAQRALAEALAAGPVELQFGDQRRATATPRARGVGALGALFWLMAAVALSLLLAGAAVMVQQPGWRNGLYQAMVLAQAGSLLIIGAESMPGLGLPVALASQGLQWRIALDLFTAACVVHLCTLPPLRVRHRNGVAATAWVCAAGLFAALAGGLLGHPWWWVQSAAVASGAAAAALCTQSYRAEPNPLALQVRRMTVVAAATLALLTLAMAVAGRAAGLAREVASVGPVIWSLFLACLLLLLPFLARSRPLMRDLAVFTGIATVALSLHLLFVAALGFEPIASLSLSVFLALALQALARRWLQGPVDEQPQSAAGRLFERLYRGVRDIEARPADCATLLPALLQDLYEPLDLRSLPRGAERARVLADGAALLVPVPATSRDDNAVAAGAWLLRFAGQGKRMFTRDDARLADLVVEQLRRALVQDRAVERGRTEERARIAQDLHDDIGARLLTLMYKAPSTEIEDYLRHTLKDLKTLTRGLAASEHRLSHAAAEWKADIAQRLGAAQIELDWAFTYDRDLALSVVEWSALTRVLRELVSNIIQHSCASHVDLSVAIEGGALRLTLADDGIGRDPQSWAHGLGLGGVRKRVKQLGGEVQWAENGQAGIVCTVRVPQLHESTP